MKPAQARRQPPGAAGATAKAQTGRRSLTTLTDGPESAQEPVRGTGSQCTRWSPADDEALRRLFLDHDHASIAAMLGRSRNAVRSRCSILGLKKKQPDFSVAEIESLRDFYERYRGKTLPLDEYARSLGRPKTSVARVARALGLTKYGRPLAPEVVEGSRVRVRAWLTEHGHPRGALGMKHDAETLAKLSVAGKRAWADPASRHHLEDNLQARSDRALRMVKDGTLLQGTAMYSRAAHGRRADLGDQFFRSRWEANYARFLNLMVERGEILSWEYEKHTFWFEAIRRGVRSYLPDFRVVFPDGHHEWHEVKGWMDPKSATKLKRMAKYYPAEIVRVIGAEWFKQVRRSGLAGAIQHWEHG